MSKSIGELAEPAAAHYDPGRLRFAQQWQEGLAQAASMMLTYKQNDMDVENVRALCVAIAASTNLKRRANRLKVIASCSIFLGPGSVTPFTSDKTGDKTFPITVRGK